MFLLEEFNPRVKIANCYFLIISGLQCIPAITNTGGYPTVLIPLSIVLLISGIFKAAEDFARHKADNQVPHIAFIRLFSLTCNICRQIVLKLKFLIGKLKYLKPHTGLKSKLGIMCVLLRERQYLLIFLSSKWLLQW